jgi:hypothetical protein
MYYKDRSYCGSEVDKHTCGREFTLDDDIAAKKWWGSEDYLVAYMEFCKL